MSAGPRQPAGRTPTQVATVPRRLRYRLRGDRRPALQVSVSRWAGDEPYEQVDVLYLLMQENGGVGMTAMVPPAMAGAECPGQV
jgi:hypothetical protein